MVLGSDIEHDGFFLELNDETENEPEVVAFAFYSDVNGQFTFSAYRPELPFGLIERFVQIARQRLPPSNVAVTE